MNKRSVYSRPPRGMRGFSMIELAVAMAVSVFLLAGLFQIMQSTHNSSDTERLLAQLQDDERIAMTLIGGVVESAGYYSSALNTSLTDALKVSANFPTAGQAVTGGTNAQGDTITLRFQANKVDGVLDCQGVNNADGVYENQFSVDANGQLVCQVNGGAAVPLVGGALQLPRGGTAPSITSLTVLYGVGTASTVPNSAGSVDAYLTAAQVNASATYWTNVYTVKVTITFSNPLYGQPGQTGAGKQNITFSRVISLKSRTGVNVSTYT